MAFISNIECPACGKTAEIDDGLVQEKITYLEKRQRIDTKKMIKKLITAEVNYKVIFPEKAFLEDDADLICSHCEYYEINWGWTYRKVYKYRGKEKVRYDIYIPRKSFFSPRDDFVDTAVVHEPTHTLVWEDMHGRKWYFLYRDNRKIAFRKFSKFINAKNTLPIKISKDKDDKIYFSDYEQEYEEEQKKLLKSKK